MSTIGLDQAPHAAGAAGESLRTLRWLKAAVVLALAVPSLIFGIVAWIAWQAAFTDARERLDRTAHVASEHAMRVFDTSNALLDRVFDLLGDDGPEALTAREKQIHDKLVAMSRSLPQLQSIWVIDAQGNALAGNRFYPRPALNVADREYFKAHAAGHGRGYVTETLWGKVTNQPFFDLSRRRETPDGRFAGLVSVGLHPQHFMDFYAKLPSSDITSVTLLRRDGAFIARWPVMPPLGSRLPADGLLIRRLAAQEQQGLLEGYSTTGQTDRVAAFRVVGDYPLVVVAATDHSAIVGGWRRDVAVLAGLTFPTALALAWVAYVALRRTQREFAVSARLQQETAHRERVEDALRHSQKLEAMGRLTGGVAHDFNNLLAVVNNNVFLIRRQHPQVGQEAPLASIERAVGAGVKLTRQLLAFSRHQPLAPRSIRLQQALPALRDLLRSAVGGAVELKVEVDADTAPIVVDVAEFELAVLNLSVNAKDAMPGGGAVELRAVAGGGQPGGRAGHDRRARSARLPGPAPKQR
jgi:two-component system, NtrC family, sensor kinase